MSDVVHLVSNQTYDESEVWCEDVNAKLKRRDLKLATCLPCLLACAEYGSEARHRYEVLRESGARP